MGLQLSAKIRTSAKISHGATKISHPSVKLLYFPSAFVSCILSFKNLTKTTKINIGKILKKLQKNENKLETKINLKLEKI